MIIFRATKNGVFSISGAGGYINATFSELPETRDGGLYTKDLLFKRIIVALGGKAAETIFYGDNYILNIIFKRRRRRDAPTLSSLSLCTRLCCYCEALLILL